METELTFGNSRVFLEAGVWWQTSIFFSLLNQERFRHFSAVLSADSTNISCYEIRHSPGNKRHIPATSMILRIEISLIHLRKLSSRDQSSTVANDNFSRPTCSHRIFTILTGSHGSVSEWNAELPHRLTVSSEFPKAFLGQSNQCRVKKQFQIISDREGKEGGCKQRRQDVALISEPYRVIIRGVL